MLPEALAAALVGVAALWLVLQPLIRQPRQSTAVFEPLDPEETPRGIALAALKEIDFDRETGKLSESDYEALKAKYTTVALEALRAESLGVTPDAVEAMVAARVRALVSAEPSRPQCATCGPRPEPDAVFCSSCGVSLAPVQIADDLPLTTANRTPASAPAT
ncbi:MAG TPA: hypothetical protein VJ808_12470 [Gemmatimonadales bacterium]|nr:hypothetical protein [Gemmatimonadales bacterium]